VTDAPLRRLTSDTARRLAEAAAAWARTESPFASALIGAAGPLAFIRTGRFGAGDALGFVRHEAAQGDARVVVEVFLGEGMRLEIRAHAWKGRAAGWRRAAEEGTWRRLAPPEVVERLLAEIRADAA
jgi:hypothetical protein